ncbi:MULTISPECIES: CAP domain-containing protein [Streptomyces]|uniref:CAP domain-containing protein n=1 Tax=Streptomyces TaxID=1883 RepID=UPI0022498660|nr:CAP domain-containing protein [Streptomyces sp. JHD 1]MCX2968141.1 CAP domain-containing protein [Streptomyces sp. JHD 1]
MSDKSLRRGAGTAFVGALVAVCALAAPAPVSAEWTGDAARSGSRVVELVNAHRAEAGCGALRPDGALDAAADAHSAHLAERRVLSHRGAGGSRVFQRARAAGYEAGRLGETLADGHGDAAAVVDAWLGSPEHRDIILDCGYRDVGVGVTRGETSTWWVQVVGTRR